jgi:hypothetical protein
LAAAGWKFEDYLSVIPGKADSWLAKHAASGGSEPFFLYYAIPAPGGGAELPDTPNA